MIGHVSHSVHASYCYKCNDWDDQGKCMANS